MARRRGLCITAGDGQPVSAIGHFLGLIDPYNYRMRSLSWGVNGNNNNNLGGTEYSISRLVTNVPELSFTRQDNKDSG